MDMTSRDALTLSELIRTELLAVPIAMWGSFFPCLVAIWRFIELRRPGILGELRAGFDSEPYFEGKGSEWFCTVLFNDEEYIQLVEQIMYPVAIELKAGHLRALERGSLNASDVPKIDTDKTGRLAELVLVSVDKAVTEGSIA
jgi:hypothetical protein